MRNRFAVLMVGLSFLVGQRAMAHHAFSGEFDKTKPVTLNGVVTSVDWQNPHVYFHVDVAASDGTVVNWTCETGGPNRLTRQGWKPNSLKAGDKVLVHGFLARNGTRMVDGRQVTLANGRKIEAESAN